MPRSAFPRLACAAARPDAWIDWDRGRPDDRPLASLRTLVGESVRGIRAAARTERLMVTVLMSDRSAWEYVDTPDAARRISGHAEPACGFTTPAYGPDVS